jgi:preprotein translocase subunit SecE
MAGALESIKTWPLATRSYIAELQTEMKRVTWPTRKQVQSTTGVVILTVFAFAVYFKIVDFAIAQTLTRLQTALTK